MNSNVNKELLLHRLRRFNRLSHLTILDLEHPKFVVLESIFLTLFEDLEAGREDIKVPLSLVHKKRQEDRRDEKRKYLSRIECRQRDEIYSSLFLEVVWNKSVKLGYGSRRSGSNATKGKEKEPPRYPANLANDRKGLYPLISYVTRYVEKKNAPPSPKRNKKAATNKDAKANASKSNISTKAAENDTDEKTVSQRANDLKNPNHPYNKTNSSCWSLCWSKFVFHPSGWGC